MANLVHLFTPSDTPDSTIEKYVEALYVIAKYASFSNRVLGALLIDRSDDRSSRLQFTYNGSGSGTFSGSLPAGEIILGQYQNLESTAPDWGELLEKDRAVQLTPEEAAAPGLPGLAGHAVAAGGRGTSLRCEYLAVNKVPNFGGCVDSGGIEYKLWFLPPPK
jgi:hypothetical protein